MRFYTANLLLPDNMSILLRTSFIEYLTKSFIVYTKFFNRIAIIFLVLSQLC